MGKLKWYQKIFTREVVGTVTERECCTRGIMHQPVTLYIITQADGAVYHGALDGHHYHPNFGDNVEMYLEKGNVLAIRNGTEQRTRADGSTEVVSRRTEWETIKRYRVLEDLV